MASSSSPVSGRTAVFTIVSKNYLHYARVLMRSLAGSCPAYNRFVLLADEQGGCFDPRAEPFELLELTALPLPDRPRFTFRYTILELNTAVKPWAFRALFDRGYRRVVYLDPDVFVYRPMTDVDQALDAGALAVLVPHLTGRLRDGLQPGEHDILQSGAYNLGFCALGAHASLEGLLDFWCEKSVHEFVVDLGRGLFTDQRWMDLVPGMFPDVAILRHEGYDVAYWNLPHRRMTRHDGGEVRVNGEPLVFFHFSGIDPSKADVFSKHQNRYRRATAGVAGDLAREYVDRLRADGADTCAAWPYAYGCLHDGSPIPDVLRQLYRTMPEIEAWAGEDPFARTCAEWNAPLDGRMPPLTRVMLACYRERADVRLTWPDVMGADRLAFTRWFAESADVAQTIAPCYLDPIRAALARLPAARPDDATRSRVLPPPTMSVGLVRGAMRKAYVAAVERRLPLSPRRWWQLYRLHVREHAQAILRREAPPLPPVDWPAAPGAVDLTIVGYLADGTGVSAGAHASVEACRAAGLTCETMDARPLRPQRGRGGVALMHVNADETPGVAALLGPAFFEERDTIGYWAWELEELPAHYDAAFEWLDEIWTPSRFVQAAVAARAPIPVVHMPHAVTVSPARGLDRAHFGLPADRFLFLVMYDVLSVPERKNPLGALEAFHRAFPDGQRAAIVLRANHARQRPDEMAMVRAAVARTPGAVLIDRPMPREEAQALQEVCDSFVSLHRAEGFGLNIAEAMLLKKPVIVTAWSGNMEFTTQANSCLVDAPLVRLTADHGPYPRGSRWAEPDLDQAAAHMRTLVEDGRLRSRIAARGHETVVAELSPAAVGARYRRRLDLIRRRRRGAILTP